MDNDEQDPEYLGDGVYATNDGWHIQLKLNDHRHTTLIYLEPKVMRRLVEYANRLADKWSAQNSKVEP